MTELAVAEFEARIVFARRSIEETERRLTTVQNRDVAIGGMASDSVQEGYCAAQLRRYGEAREAFRRATRWTLERIATRPPERSEGYNWMHAIEYALLSGDQEMESLAAAGEPSAGYKWRHPLGRGYYRALRSSVLKDTARVRAAATEIAAVSDEEAVRQKFNPRYPRLGAAMQALLDRDDRVLRAALEAILEQHLRYVRGKGHLHWAAEGLLCVPAISLALLAQCAGIAVTVSDRFHQVGMRFPVRYLQEWQGQPVRGQELEITADLLPPALFAMEAS